MGDTDIFGDMGADRRDSPAGRRHGADRRPLHHGAGVGGPGGQRFFKLRAVIPCHYGSFPLIEPTADRFVAAMDGHGTQVIVPHKTVGVRI